MKRILVISLCKEKMHEREFVNPIVSIIKEKKINFELKHYLDLTEVDFSLFSHIIISGTSYLDNDYLDKLSLFNWVFDFKGKVLGICSGMQIIGLLFGGKLKQKKEIGFYFEEFIKPFLGLSGKQEVYHLHNNYISNWENFNVYSNLDIPQAVKHKSKDIYGVLFHPEVRNKEVILNFLN